MHHTNRWTGLRAARLARALQRLALGMLAACLLLGAGAAVAQPAGWTYAYPITVTENSGATLNGYQLRLTIDTASMIAASALNADGSDLRFATDLAGTSPLNYYLDSGINTASTVVWVKLGTLPASSSIGIFMFSGNPSATSASTLNVFDYTDPLNNSATNQVNSGGPGGVGNSQRGFRFSPNEDILVTDFGKDEPTGTTRYVTLFDFATQAIVAQTQVPGPAASYSYAPLAQPVWLTAGTQYVLELYQNASDGYYFGSSSQINPKLTYFDMRYCNSCTQNTFPTNTLTNFQYGYPDFQFRTHQQVSPAPTYVLGAGSTTTTLTGNATSVFGETVSFTATVNGVFNPTGTVSFLDGASPLAGCTGAVPLSGTTAVCTTSQLVIGPHSLTAAYSGDASNAPSTSAVFGHTVGPAGTTTMVSAPGPITLGAGVTVTVTLGVQSPGSGTPSGSIAVSDGSATCNILLPATTCTLTPTSAGNKTVTATYPGDANFTGSSGNTALTVNAGASSVSVSSNIPTSTFGQTVTFTATVTGTTPTGTVTFNDGANPIVGCTNPATLSGGTATCAVGTLSVGSHSISAVYSGDANNTGSSSAPFTQTVNGAATGTTLTSNAAPSVFGQAVTFTATVGGNTPTGTVTFNDGANPVAGCTNPATLASGVATCTTSTLAVGAHSITAVYSGDANNSASTSVPLAQTVGQAATTTSVAPLAAITQGQSVTVVVTVAPVAPGAGTPTGTISVVDGAASCTITLPANSCSLTPTASGTQTVTATYAGDANFSGSSGSTSLVVNGQGPAVVAATPALERWALLLLVLLIALGGAASTRVKPR